MIDSNGVGKSCLDKSTIGIIRYSGKIETDSSITVVGSYSGIPRDLSIRNIFEILYKVFSKETVDEISTLLSIYNINKSMPLGKMSDGQKQRVKLLCFLVSKPKIIILDEFTSTLDKSTCIDVYKFLSEYIKNNDTTIVNITHNLADVEKISGNYYYIENCNITKVSDKKKLFKMYVN